MTKLKRKNAYMVFAIIGVLAIIGISFASAFTIGKSSEINVYPVSVDANIDLVEDLSDVVQGDTVVNGISFSRLDSSKDIFVRANLNYYKQSNITDDDKRFLLSINYEDIPTFVGTDYKWTRSGDGYYYLTDLQGVPLKVTSSTPYTFCEEITYTGATSIRGEIHYISDLRLEANIQAINAREVSTITLSNISELFSNTFASSNMYGYIVTFDTDGAGDISAQTFLSDNQKVVQPTQPNKIGYDFVGWYTDSSFTAEYDFNNVVSSSFTLYAKFKLPPYTFGELEADHVSGMKYFVEMGEYPQSLYTGETNALTQVTGETYDIDGSTCNVYTDGTDRYVEFTMSSSNNGYSSNSNYASYLGTKYYKIEPVRWIVIGQGDGSALPSDFDIYNTTLDSLLVISENILVQQMFNPLTTHTTSNNDTAYADWEGSQIRTYMNGTLLDQLFDETQQSLLQSTTLTTTYLNTSGTITNITTTGDKLFNLAISRQNGVDYSDTYLADLLNNDTTVQYGNTYSSLRATATDMARATGVYYNASTGFGYWGLRSGFYNYHNFASFVLGDGLVGCDYVNLTANGVRAAFVLAIV